jgi:transcriptional regulator GlxA family with amidase domain
MPLQLQIAIFDGFDEIDVFGPYEMLSVPGIEVQLATAEPTSSIRSMRSIVIEPQAKLGACDGIIVPGGGWGNHAAAGAWGEVQRGVLPARLTELAPHLPWLASVCSGGMILASAGLLGGRPATTNPGCFDDFRPLVGAVIEERVVDDGDRLTAGALFCGNDLGLWIIERELGTAAADRASATKAYARQGRVWRSGISQT